MNTNERSDYIKIRLDSAYKTLEAAKILAENGFWNSAVNRLYYAVFYAVNALLTQKKIRTKTHSSTINQFSLHFIHSGIFDIKYGKLLSKLFDWRQKSDYDNYTDYDQESVEPLFVLVKDMIEEVERHLQDS